MSITFPCTECGQKYQVGPELAGKKMRCKKCGSVQTIPVPRRVAAPSPDLETPRSPATPAPIAAASPKAPKAKSFSAPPPAFDPFGDAYGPAGSSASNPYDLDDAGPAKKPANGDAELDDFVMPRPGRPRPMSNGRRKNDNFGRIALYTAAGVGGLLALFALIGIFSPIGVALFFIVCGLTTVVLLTTGSIWQLVNAFREDVACGFLHFLPIYPLYYLITRWDVQKRPFFTQLAAFVPIILAATVGVGLVALQANKAGKPNVASSPSASNEVAAAPPSGVPGTPPMPPRPPQIHPGMSPDQIRSEMERHQREVELFSRQQASRPPAPNPPPPATAPRVASKSDSFADGSFSRGSAPQPTVKPTTPQFTRGGEGGFASSAPSLWKVDIDPPADPVDFASFRDVKISIPSPHHKGIAVFPTAPSEFVVVGRNDNANESREVWSLKDGKRVARLVGKVEIDEPIMLSADGASLAGLVPHKNAVVAFDLKNNKKIGQLDFPSHKPDWIDFAGKDRLALGFFWDKSIQIWDLKQGQQVANIPTERFAKEATTVSPGGRYLATITEHTLHIYDTSNGEEVGMEALPKGNNNWDMDGKGLAFSADGKELAAIGEAFGKPSLVVWEVATGKQVAQFGPYESELKKSFGYEGPALRWLPGGEGWLVYGDSIVERGSGKKIWSLPFDNANYRASERMLLGLDRALTVAGRTNQLLATMPLDRKTLAAAVKIASEGGNPLDAALPNLTAVDMSGAKQVDSPRGSVTWSAGIDPQPAATKIAKRPVTLKCKPGEVVRIVFSGPTTPVAAVASQPDKGFAHQPPNPEGKPLVVDRFDLTNGKHLGRQELGPLIDLVAISPDASTILTGSYKDRDRLDAFDPSSKAIAGWRPYSKESGEDRQVTWADFLDAQHVLTINKAGTLILWSLPTCKAEYILEDAGQGTPAFSPGRKYLATYHDGGMRLIDPASGLVVGDTATAGGNPGPNGVTATAFLPNGTELAALVGPKLVRWEMAGGKLVGEFAAPSQGKSLEYCGPNHAMVDSNALYDLGRSKVIWYYNGGVQTSGSPDGLHWLVLGNPFNAGQLGSLALPGAKVEQLVAQSEDKSIPATLKPGARLSVALESGNPPREVDKFRKELSGILAEKISSIGATSADGQAVKLVARITEKATGETIEFHRMGPSFGRDAGPANQTISLRNLECELAIVDGQGSISIAKTTMYMRQFGIIHLPANETNVEAFMLNEAWNGAKNWFRMVGMPSYAARNGGEVVLLPGNTDLSQLVK